LPMWLKVASTMNASAKTAQTTQIWQILNLSVADLKSAIGRSDICQWPI